MVERRDLNDSVPLSGSNNGRIDATERQVVVLGNQLRNPDQIGSMDRLDCDAAGGEVSEEPDFRLPAQSCGEQVYDLSNDKTRDQQGAGIRLEKFQTARMMSIVGVDVGVQGTRVDDQRDCVASATTCDVR
jgi:hypothetical protein